MHDVAVEYLVGILGLECPSVIEAPQQISMWQWSWLDPSWGNAHRGNSSGENRYLPPTLWPTLCYGPADFPMFKITPTPFFDNRFGHMRDFMQTHYFEDLIPEEQEAPRGNGEMVLVVDDDPALRMISEMLLEDSGYQVLQPRMAPTRLHSMLSTAT